MLTWSLNFPSRFLTKLDDDVHKDNQVFTWIAGSLPEQYQAWNGRVPHKKQHRSLTSRESEILQSIAESKSNKQMATDLRISIKTVEKHRCKLMQKLGIHETAGLTRYAIAAGIIKCEPMPGAIA
jgi:DNA-binding NarL/FixJ family response regulator